MEDLQARVSELESRLGEHRHDNLDGTTDLPRRISVSNTALGGGTFFIATSPCVVKKVFEIHSGTATGSVEVRKMTGTTAVSSGTMIHTTAFALATATDTLQKGVLTNTSGIPLALGDRLGTYENGSRTGINGECITVEIEF